MMNGIIDALIDKQREAETSRILDECTALIQMGVHARDLVICSHPNGYQHARRKDDLPCALIVMMNEVERPPERSKP